MKSFLGIGAGPIQTGIFINAVSLAGFDRICIADVDPALVDAIQRAHSITINSAGVDQVVQQHFQHINALNPKKIDDLRQLLKIAANADVISTALPSTAFYAHVAPWLREAFNSAPDKLRHIYTAENSTTAAHELQLAIGKFPNTHYLDTVIGKMSKVFTSDECDLPTLAPGLDRGHLVEEFNTIYTSSIPGVESPELPGLYPKDDLVPFEEAKLYGHNASHFLLGTLASRAGCVYMDQTREFPDIINKTTSALIDECGTALCRKFAGRDPFFSTENFRRYAMELVPRMTSRTLRDSVERVVRDPARKLGWNDRLIGAIRLCLSQHVSPSLLAECARITMKSIPGSPDDFLRKLWENADPGEIDAVLGFIKQQ